METWGAPALVVGSGWRMRLRRMAARVRGAVAAFPDETRYVGAVNEEGHPHGYGVMDWRDGRRFKGSFRDGLPDGDGVMAWSDGMKYAGTWRDGLPDGKGIETMPDGTSIEVEYRGGPPQHVPQWLVLLRPGVRLMEGSMMVEADRRRRYLRCNGGWSGGRSEPVPHRSRFTLVPRRQHERWGVHPPFMLEKVLDAHGGELPPRCEAIFANTGKERPETLDFVQEVTERWGVPISWVEFGYVPGGKPKYRANVVTRGTAATNGEPFEVMLRVVSYMPSVTERICTSELKVQTIDRYLWQTRKLTKRQTRKLIGFRFDEPARWKPALYQECAVAYPMVDAGVTKADVAAFWQSQPFDLGIESRFGNCDLCYLKQRRNLLETLRAEPWRADWWIEAERRRGRTFRIGESFAQLRDAALAPVDTGETSAGDEDEAGLPCFCTD